MIDTYLNQTIGLIGEANEMLISNAVDSLNVIEGLMHKLKGSSGNVRAQNVMHLALEAENLAKTKSRTELEKKINEIEGIVLQYNLERGL